LIYCAKVFRANRPVLAQGKLDTRADHTAPDNTTAVGGDTGRSTERRAKRRIVKLDYPLCKICPGSAACYVDQRVSGNQTSTGTDRSARINLSADPHGLAHNHGLIERAIPVQVRFDADQTAAKLIVVADLCTAREKTTRRRSIVEVRGSHPSADVAADVETCPAMDRL